MEDHLPSPTAPPPPSTPPAPDRAAAQRELERAKRADAARITALVQYMLHERDDPPTG
jgi:hypothetical protein